jgi:flagellar protein FliS
MSAQRGLSTYKQTQVQSRTPLELVVMLYDGALLSIRIARHAIERRDIAARREALQRALAIISELQSTLNMEQGGSIAQSLDDLYSYATARLIQSAVDNAVGPLDDVVRLLEPLRDTWAAISGNAPVAAEAPVRGAA